MAVMKTLLMLAALLFVNALPVAQDDTSTPVPQDDDTDDDQCEGNCGVDAARHMANVAAGGHPILGKVKVFFVSKQATNEYMCTPDEFKEQFLGAPGSSAPSLVRAFEAPLGIPRTVYKDLPNWLEFFETPLDGLTVDYIEHAVRNVEGNKTKALLLRNWIMALVNQRHGGGEDAQGDADIAVYVYPTFGAPTTSVASSRGKVHLSRRCHWSALGHEIGHTFGLGHAHGLVANGWRTYGDASLMGAHYACSQLDQRPSEEIAAPDFNAGMRLKAGWLHNSDVSAVGSTDGTNNYVALRGLNTAGLPMYSVPNAKLAAVERCDDCVSQSTASLRDGAEGGDIVVSYRLSEEQRNHLLPEEMAQYGMGGLPSNPRQRSVHTLPDRVHIHFAPDGSGRTEIWTTLDVGEGYLIPGSTPPKYLYFCGRHMAPRPLPLRNLPFAGVSTGSTLEEASENCKSHCSALSTTSTQYKRCSKINPRQLERRPDESLISYTFTTRSECGAFCETHPAASCCHFSQGMCEGNRAFRGKCFCGAYRAPAEPELTPKRGRVAATKYATTCSAAQPPNGDQFDGIYYDDRVDEN